MKMRICGVVASFLLMLSPARANELIVCDDVTDPATFDPHKQFSEKNHTVVQQIYEGLVRFDPDGNVQPALAESWERLDPLRIRFHLRKDVSFHNGDPFNSRAVKFSIERYLNPATQFPAFAFISSLSGAEVIDDYTIDIVTHFPDGLLLNRLAGFILIVPPKYLAANGENALHEMPIGTGPFKFEGREKGKYILLSANRNYWMKGFPKVDALRFVFIPEPEQVDAILNKKIDILTELPGTRTLHMMESGGQVIKKNAFYTVATSFRTDKGPFADIRVRKALNHAVDREEMIRYDLLANGVPLATMSMAGEVGHNASLVPYSFDRKKAIQLLNEAGYKNGLKIKAFTKVQGERAARIIRGQLKLANIDMSLDVKTDAEIPAAVASGQYDLGVGGCPDPMAHSFFIQSIFLFSQSPYSLVKNETYDKMLTDMMTTLDVKEQQRKGEILDKWIYDNAMGIFTYQRLKTYGCSKGIIFKPSVTGMPYFYAVEKK
jgi:peptide/nickel transport system substrate-binding protein